MSLKDRITTEVLDQCDHSRVESQDMRCLCETLAICFDELITSVNGLKEQTKFTREVLDEMVADVTQKANFELWKEDK